MQLGIAALFIIWVISRSNLSTTNGNNTPSPKWVINNPANFPISFTQGLTKGSIGIQMWSGTPAKFRNYVVYQGGNITPLTGEFSSKQQAITFAHRWLTDNADAPDESISPQSIDSPVSPPPEATAPAEVTITDIQTGRMKAVNQEVNSLSLNGTQDYALNG